MLNAKEKRKDASTKEINSGLKNLSKLLAIASGSTCVAATVIDTKIVVASNNFSKGMALASEASKGLENVKEILQYFKKFIEEIDITTVDRNRIFKLICENQKASTSDFKYSFKLGSKNFDEVFQQVLARKPANLDEYRTQFKGDRIIAWEAYGRFRDLLYNFEKIHKCFKGKKELLKIIPEVSDDKDQSGSILKKEPQSGVHAEIQILAEIVQKLQDTKNKNVDDLKKIQDFYVAISKLCCITCSEVLKKINEYLTKKELPNLLYKGEHDLRFEKWAPSRRFTPRQVNPGEPSRDLFDEIYTIIKQVQQEVEAKEENKKDKNKKNDEIEFINQSPDPSSYSSPDHIDMGVTVHRFPLAKVLVDLNEDISNWENEDLVGLDRNKIIPLIIELIRVREFRDLFTRQDVKGLKFKALYETILSEASKNNEKFQTEYFFKIMTNKELVGQELAEGFKATINEGPAKKKLRVAQAQEQGNTAGQQSGGLLIMSGLSATQSRSSASSSNSTVASRISLSSSDED